MFEFLRDLFTSDFMPHGHCYFWKPEIVWLHVVSDAFITLAYYSIPLALAYFVRKRKDLAFNWMFLMFGAFILACGTTHLIEVWTVWHGTYRLAGVVKLATALLSIGTAVVLWPLIPRALKLPSPAQLETANAALQTEIAEQRRLQEALQSRTIQLEDALKEMESFSYSVSHDLRAPLRSIDGFSHALLEECDHKLDDRDKEHLRLVRTASQRMGLLIDGLLVLNRLSRSEMHRERVDLSEIARSIAMDLKKSDPERNVAFQIEDGLTANGDPRLLHIVLNNLFGNAWKFTSKHPSARIEFGRAEREGKQVLCLRDDGAGFDMAYASKLFGPFQRLHGVHEFDGTGIGLATAQRIIHRHGGKIWAESAIQKGAAFYFTL